MASQRHKPRDGDTRDGAAADEPRIDAAALFREHARFVANFLARLGAARADIDDLVQEVFLVAHRRGGFVPGRARATTWLAEIALRVNSAHRRRGRRRHEDPNTSEIVTAVDGGHGPGAQAETRQALERVQTALEALDEPKRAVFVLFELAGESCESIAAGLGIPVGTVYSRLHKARKLFKAAHAKLLTPPANAPTKRAVGSV
ncbi:MAG: sigma-70 family RNA polymerase sigma factor [Myxococcales bacterium]|nr:sigma-70 family RNA polymerase sigma factor [Myxococcales bacterium]